MDGDSAAYQTDAQERKAYNDPDRLMILCAWCSLMIQYGQGRTSHGICNACKSEFFPDIPAEVGLE